MAVTFDAHGLIDRVGSLLRIDINATSVPSDSEVDDWLEEGANVLLRLLPLEEQMEFRTFQVGTFTPSLSSSYNLYSVEILNPLKLVALYDSNNAPIDIVDIDTVLFYSKYVNTYVVATVIGKDATTKSEVLLSKNPGDIRGAVISEVVTSSSDVPYKWHSALVEYAVALAKEQEGQYGLRDAWLAKYGGMKQ
jgi:hypothetical protein